MMLLLRPMVIWKGGVPASLDIGAKQAFVTYRTVVSMHKCQSHKVNNCLPSLSYWTSPSVLFMDKCAQGQHMIVQTRGILKGDGDVKVSLSYHEGDKVSKDYETIYYKSKQNDALLSFSGYFIFSNFFILSMMSLLIVSTENEFDKIRLPLLGELAVLPTCLFGWSGVTLLMWLFILARHRSGCVLRIYKDPKSDSYIAVRKSLMGTLRNVNFTKKDIVPSPGILKVVNGNVKLLSEKVYVYPDDFVTPNDFHILFPNGFVPEGYTGRTS